MTNQNNEKSKNGKRLALILIAILLLVAIAFGAYTYSRYVTRDSGTGSAPVAMWGYKVKIGNADSDYAANNNGFAQNYEVREGGSNATAATDNTNAVIARVTSKGNIVAPGAAGAVSFTVSGTGEVSAELVAAISATAQISITVQRSGGEETITYVPMVYTLTKADAEEPLVTGTLGTVANYLNNGSEGGQKALGQFNPGTIVTAPEYTLSWEWAFTGDNQTVGSYTITADALDTALGQIAAASGSADGITVLDTAGNTWTVSSSSITETFSLIVTMQQTQEHYGS